MTAPTKQQIAETLADHHVSMASNAKRVWVFCHCNPNVELLGIESTVAPEVDAFYDDATEADITHVAEQLAALWPQPETSGIEYGLAVARDLLQKVADYWDGRPLTHHGDHIMADLLDVLRAITPADTEAQR